MTYIIYALKISSSGNLHFLKCPIFEMFTSFKYVYSCSIQCYSQQGEVKRKTIQYNKLINSSILYSLLYTNEHKKTFKEMTCVKGEHNPKSFLPNL